MAEFWKASAIIMLTIVLGVTLGKTEKDFAVVLSILACCAVMVIAMGYPAQESFVVPMEDTIRYTQDESGNFLVPKWNTEDILVFDQ